jgi:acetyl-CoA C-acetyltransferase
VGATGLYQAVEAVQQLRGQALDNQLHGARVGMTQNIGGSGAVVFTHILERLD